MRAKRLRWWIERRLEHLTAVVGGRRCFSNALERSPGRTPDTVSIRWWGCKRFGHHAGRHRDKVLGRWPE